MSVTKVKRARANDVLAPKKSTESPVRQAAWTLNEWLSECRFSRSFYYSLPPHKRPNSVFVTSRKRVITESPPDYFARLEEDAA